jgi:protein-tyrosine-phosphatase/predicted ATP-grasp superfamily ATP-dependent carboligase
MTGKVLVLGHDSRAFLAAVRSLGRRGLVVHAAWCPQDAPARRSRYIRVLHELPPFSAEDSSWKQALKRLLEREHFDLLIPCEDPTLLPIRAHRAEFEPLVRLALPEDEALEVALDKIRSWELAKNLGIPVPHGAVVRDPSDLDRLGLRPPLVLKPRTTFRFPDLTNRRSVRTFAALPSLRAYLEQDGVQDAVLLQEFVPGIGVGVEVLANRGEVLVAFQHRRVHEPLTGGGSSYRVSVPLDPRLLEAARALMGALGYTGVAMVEFRVDPSTGRWVFLEINSRFWGSLPLAVACGADFPYYLYGLLVLRERRFPQTYRVGVYARNLTLDLVWLREYLRAWRSSQRRSLPSPLRVVGELANLLLLREHNDTLTLDDPAPGWAEMASVGRSLWAQATGHLRRLSLRLAPVRRLELARLRRRLGSARSVLFVCRGNLCRSPFAEGYARRVFPASVRVRSAGTRAKDGTLSPPEAAAVAAAFGVDLRGHRAARLSEALLGEADVVLVFDATDLERVRRAFPHHARKVFLLGLLNGDREVTIRDPYGAGVDRYRDVYGAVARALDRAARLVAVPERGPAREVLG